MKTTRDIVELIGRDRFKEGLNLGDKSVERAEQRNLFTATWYKFIRLELQRLGVAEPDLDLFAFR